MKQDDIISMAIKAGFGDRIYEEHEYELACFAAIVAAAERKVIMDSLQKQADLATDALDRRWALEMIAAVAAIGEKRLRFWRRLRHHKKF